MISLVQHAALYDTGTLTQNLPLSFSANVKPGNFIVVAITAFISTVTGVTDNAYMGSNTYTQVPNSPATNGSDNTYIYYAKNVTGGPITVTVAFNAASHIRSFGIYEYAGVDPTAPFDKSASGSATSTTVTPGSLTPANNGSLIISIGTDFAVGGTGAITPASGYTLEDSQADNTTHQRYYYEDFIQTTAAATTASFTITASGSYAVVAAVFKPANNAKVATLIDAFNKNTVDLTKWNVFTELGGVVTENGGTLNNTPVAMTNGSWAGVYSVSQYDLTASTIYVQLVQSGSGNTWVDLTLSTQPLDSSNFISIGVDTGYFDAGFPALVAGDEINDNFVVRASIAYNPATMKWLRIRESSGTVFFEYAASVNGPWTTLDSRAAAVSITALYVVLDDYEYDGAGTPGTEKLNNLNTSSTTHSLSALGAGS